MPLRYPDKPSTHISNVKVGDTIFTSFGYGNEIVYKADKFRFSSDHYGNVPYFEGGNGDVFKIIKKKNK